MKDALQQLGEVLHNTEGVQEYRLGFDPARDEGASALWRDRENVRLRRDGIRRDIFLRGGSALEKDLPGTIVQVERYTISFDGISRPVAVAKTQGGAILVYDFNAESYETYFNTEFSGPHRVDMHIAGKFLYVFDRENETYHYVDLSFKTEHEWLGADVPEITGHSYATSGEREENIWGFKKGADVVVIYRNESEGFWGFPEQNGEIDYSPVLGTVVRIKEDDDPTEVRWFVHPQFDNINVVNPYALSNTPLILPGGEPIRDLVGTTGPFRESGGSVSANEGYEDPVLYKSYVAVYELNDGSFTNPSRPVLVEVPALQIFDAFDLGVYGISLDISALSAPSSATRLHLYASRWQISRSNTVQPNEIQPQGAFYHAGDFSVDEDEIVDRTPDSELMNSLNVHVPTANGIPIQFGKNQISPDSVTSFQNGLFIGGYSINRFDTEDYVYSEGVGGGFTQFELIIQAEFTDGTLSTPMDVYLRDTVRIQFQRISTLVRAFRIYLRNLTGVGPEYYFVDRITPEHARFYGLPFEIDGGAVWQLIGPGNGNFNSDITGWAALGADIFHETGDDVIMGSGSLRAENISVSNTVYTPINFETGNLYRVRFKIRMLAANTTDVQIMQYNIFSGSKNLKTVLLSPGSGTVHQVDSYYYVESAVSADRLGIGLTGEGPNFVIDDVSVELIAPEYDVDDGPNADDVLLPVRLNNYLLQGFPPQSLRIDEQTPIDSVQDIRRLELMGVDSERGAAIRYRFAIFTDAFPVAGFLSAAIEGGNLSFTVDTEPADRALPLRSEQAILHLGGGVLFQSYDGIYLLGGREVRKVVDAGRFDILSTPLRDAAYHTRTDELIFLGENNRALAIPLEGENPLFNEPTILSWPTARTVRCLFTRANRLFLGADSFFIETDIDGLFTDSGFGGSAVDVEGRLTSDYIGEAQMRVNSVEVAGQRYTGNLLMDAQLSRFDDAALNEWTDGFVTDAATGEFDLTMRGDVYALEIRGYRPRLRLVLKGDTKGRVDGVVVHAVPLQHKGAARL